MIHVQILEKLDAEPENRESWISAIPNWDNYEGFDLLSAVGWYVDAVFNDHQLERLDSEIARWADLVETSDEDDADALASEIADLRQLVREARKRPSYVVFKGW